MISAGYRTRCRHCRVHLNASACFWRHRTLRSAVWMVPHATKTQIMSSDSNLTQGLRDVGGKVTLITGCFLVPTPTTPTDQQAVRTDRKRASQELLGLPIHRIWPRQLTKSQKKWLKSLAPSPNLRNVICFWFTLLRNIFNMLFLSGSTSAFLLIICDFWIPCSSWWK